MTFQFFPATREATPCAIGLVETVEEIHTLLAKVPR